MKANHKVSVVVLTKNSAATVRKTLESVFNQTRMPDEVIVVDGNSKDNTLDIVRRFPVKIVTEPGAGFGHARNVGIENATGDIVLFIDSDCYAEPKWIEKAVSHFDSPEIAGVTGQTRLWNTNSGVAKFLACVGGRMNMPTRHMYVKIAPTMNLAVRREIVKEVGSFDETLIRCEDTDLTYKISQKYKILYEPDAVVWFRGSPTIKAASKKCLRYFVGVGQLFAKHGLNPAFVRFNLPVRGFLLILALVSLFFAPWYVPAVLSGLLLLEFIYKVVKMYRRFRDPCVIYYAVFFTLWSLSSLAIFYGLYLGLKNRHRRKNLVLTE